jgi:hypothetical protein
VTTGTCECGRTFPQRQGRGRQYRFCEVCRPRRKAPRPNETSPDWLLNLPDAVARAEDNGRPVIVAWPLATLGPMPEDTQRLYATVGVLVRFVPPRTEE